ncbi:hydrolase [Hirschia litorea]|uniref:Hydrolase n=1 Tax=Hirschia litorea TaxID=1199156 RepID=A0ABW2IIJ7_9PROT
MSLTQKDILRLASKTPEDDIALQMIRDRQDAMVAQTVEWAKINTGSWNAQGLLKFAPLLVDAFSVLDAVVEAHPTAPIEKINNQGEQTLFETGPVVTIRARPHAPVQVVMTGHYDTVFPEGSFENISDIGDGKLNGPGLADMKGGIVVMLEALKAFEAGPYKEKLGYSITLSPDEETGNFASAPFIMEAAKSAHIGLTFEPAMESGAMSGARKGSAIYDFIFKGLASHAGRAPEAGRSAVLAAAEFVTGIEKLDAGMDSVTFNVGAIDGGNAVNIVPDNAVVRLGIRAPDQTRADLAVRSLETLLAKVLKRDGISGKMVGSFYRPPKPRNAAQSRLFDVVDATAGALGLSLTFQDTGGVCEGNNVFQAGTPNIDTLGVRGGNIHSSDEFVVIESFAERAGLTALILNRLADGRVDAAHIKSLMNEES